ncbi:MAG: hypothetical protein Ta2B_11670 [Termitinemataceae bacterium]|nr:MAG: hypothetical protein Ta2B_11670 [Termitinemataceae bacterium]
MILIDVRLDNEGILESAHIKGHSGQGTIGSDIICAAVSALVMAAEHTLCSLSAVETEFIAPVRGEFLLKTHHEGANFEEKVYLKAVGDFLINGFSAAAEESPENCSITIRRIQNGS